VSFEPAEAHVEGVEPRSGYSYCAPGGRDRPGLEPDGLERPDDLSGLVERGDVPLSEQLGDERRVLVLALELEREDPVEFVLLDARAKSAPDIRFRSIFAKFGGRPGRRRRSRDPRRGRV